MPSPLVCLALLLLPCPLIEQPSPPPAPEILDLTERRNRWRRPIRRARRRDFRLI